MNLPQGAWEDPGNPIHQNTRDTRYVEVKQESRYGTCDTCKCDLNEIEFNRKQNNCDWCEEEKK